MARFARRLVPVAILACLLGFAVPAHAAPANDNIAQATQIPLDGLPYSPAPYSTAGAGVENGEPAPACSLSGSGASVWYRWIDATAPADLTVSTAGSTAGSEQLDTVLAAFHQTNGQYVMDVCNDDSSDSQSNETALRTSTITFQAAANTVYLIQVSGSKGRDGVNPETGSLRFTVSRRPVNDDFRNAIEIKALPFADLLRNTVGATDETGEATPSCVGAAKATVWYRHTFSGRTGTDQNLRLFADTFGSNFDTVLAMYSQTPAGLVQLACNDDAPGVNQSRVDQVVQPGTYWFQVAGKAGAVGMLSFHTGQQPVNDAFALATAVSGVPFSATQSTAGAGRENTEPQPSCLAAGNIFGASVWFKLSLDPTAVSDPVTIDTIGSNYNTVLAVYEGAELGALTQVACGASASSSKVTLPAPASPITYAVQVSSTGPTTGSTAFAGGTLILNVPPANNDLASARQLTPSALPFSETRNNLGATTEPAEKQPSCVAANTTNASVWYQLNIPTGTPTATYTVSTVGSLLPDGSTPFDTAVSVVTGSAEVAGSCSDDYGNLAPWSRSQFSGVAGSSYFIRVAGKANAIGNLSVSISSQPACDTMANACVVGKPFSVIRTAEEIASATLDAGEPVIPSSCLSTGAIKNSLWYKHTATSSGLLQADTVGSFHNTVISAYTGTPPALTRVTCNAGNAEVQAKVSFPAVNGTTYYFQVGSVGDLVNQLHFHVAPDGNDIANAINLPAIPATTTGASTVGASAEPGEQRPSDTPAKLACAAEPSATIWYKATLAAPASLTVSTAGSDYDTVLGVFQLDGTTVTPITCNNDDGVLTTSKATFSAGAGTYLFQIGGNIAKEVPQTGFARLSVTAAPPSNDTVDNAMRIGTPSTSGSGARISDTKGTYGATYVNEPAPGCASNPGATVWYAFTATSKLKLDVDTLTSNFATFIAVYSAPLPSSTPLATQPALGCSADAGTPGQAHVGFTSVPGITYYIQIGGVNGAAGKAVMNLLARPSL